MFFPQSSSVAGAQQARAHPSATISPAKAVGPNSWVRHDPAQGGSTTVQCYTSIPGCREKGKVRQTRRCWLNTNV
jgi:hypothetical protein